MSLDWISAVIDWDTCKVQFEVLGDSLERVSMTHDIPLSSLKKVAAEESWTQRPTTTKNLDQYLHSVISVHKTKLSLAALYRDMELFPRLIKAENDLLNKITSAISLVDPSEPEAPKQLRALGQGLNAISERKVLTEVSSDTATVEDNTWTVEIKKSEQALTLVTEKTKAIQGDKV